MAKTFGYFGTPLESKLGIKARLKIKIINPPEYYYSLFTEWPELIYIEEDEIAQKDLIHFFVKEQQVLFNILPLLKKEIKQNGMIWVSWPKKASKVYSDIDENVIRNYALEIGLVDVKVCAVDKIWSGLKPVIGKSNRDKK